MADEKATTYHAAISVDIDRFDDARLRRDWLRQFRDVTTVDDLRRACADMRARGFAVFPACDNVRADGHCLGHEVPRGE